MIDITDMMRQTVNYSKSGRIKINPADSYSIKDNVWDNWAPFVLSGLHKYGGAVSDLGIVGTGAGADAIGVKLGFIAYNLFVTNLDENDLSLALMNLSPYMGGRSLQGYTGNLLEPFIERGIKLDIIVENLANIPISDEEFELETSGSFFNEQHLASFNNELAEAYLLLPHYACLVQAKQVLKSRGRLVMAIGGRVPLDIVKNMVEGEGYSYKEIFTGIKVQTEPEEVLQSYAKAEQKLEFDFYALPPHMVDAINLGIVQQFNMDGERLKKGLTRHRINAKEALRLYEQGKTIGHTVHVVSAWNKS
ncbi:hypothetical protein GOV09_03235 [Candidatus Woesearchaeota archaeon]|nr:hypothetical protein [Candidatus Woesearchaeota archaeon]